MENRRPGNGISASFSKLVIYEQCPYRAKLAWLDKIPDTQPRPAADRGTLIHTLCEDYVKGTLPEPDTLPPELKFFSNEFNALRDRYQTQPRSVTLEEEWGFTQDWEPTPYASAWLRMKADATVQLSQSEALVIDQKTGKRFGNEIKHGEQCQFYAIGLLMRSPEIDTVHTELWYLDKDELASLTLKRKELPRYLRIWDKRLKAFAEDTTFEPRPNIVSCKWCPYHASRQGDCPHGV